LNRFPESLAGFQEAVRLDPHYAEGWNNLGNVAAELGLNDRAERAFQRSLLLLPGYSLAEANLAQLLKRRRAAITNRPNRLRISPHPSA
jgi:tetratricopeptide (TPR) repeat protein